ncbi:winged helix-turn-helix domain-containing protein [Tardiphaga sp.]|uniref:winged helix-turn-helix domain-containing protein n=1 Tax=Tardiphaga sp. TaxID=1926292 RepID=UPI00352A7A42
MIRIGALKLKAQIFCGVESAIGPGKADLLEAIDREGSISAAGRSMGMSYRRTWLLVDALNRCWLERVVETVSGGSRERGARLTDFGRQLLFSYRDLETLLADAADDGRLNALLSLLRDRPLPKQTSLRSRNILD